MDDKKRYHPVVGDIVMTEFGDIGEVETVLTGGLGQEDMVEIRYLAYQRYPKGAVGKYMTSDVIPIVFAPRKGDARMWTRRPKGES